MSKRSETRKIKSKLEVLLKSYYEIIGKLSKDLSKEDRKKKIMGVLKSYDGQWRRYCTEHKGSPPNPDLFAKMITKSNEINEEAIKKEIKIIKPPFRQKVVAAFWALFYPHKYSFLQALRKGKVTWKEAYDIAKEHTKTI